LACHDNQFLNSADHESSSWGSSWKRTCSTFHEDDVSSRIYSSGPSRLPVYPERANGRSDLNRSGWFAGTGKSSEIVQKVTIRVATTNVSLDGSVRGQRTDVGGTSSDEIQAKAKWTARRRERKSRETDGTEAVANPSIFGVKQ
jgi:hypothetical protein